MRQLGLDDVFGWWARTTAEGARSNTGLLPSGGRVFGMSKAKTDRRRRVPPIVIAVVQPVARRLSRIEALLIEMRNEQDVQLRRTTALQAQLDALNESFTDSQRMSLRRKTRRRPASR